MGNYSKLIGSIVGRSGLARLEIRLAAQFDFAGNPGRGYAHPERCGDVPVPGKHSRHIANSRTPLWYDPPTAVKTIPVPSGPLTMSAGPRLWRARRNLQVRSVSVSPCPFADLRAANDRRSPGNS